MESMALRFAINLTAKACPGHVYFTGPPAGTKKEVGTTFITTPPLRPFRRRVPFKVIIAREFDRGITAAYPRDNASAMNLLAHGAVAVGTPQAGCVDFKRDKSTKACAFHT